MILSRITPPPSPAARGTFDHRPRVTGPDPASAPFGSGMRRHGVITLPAEARQVCTVRRFAAALLARWGVAGDDLDSVLLIVGELAGNAAQHGRADMTVSLTLEERSVCVEVVDSGTRPAAAHPRCGSPCDERGRGLDIVDHLADRTETREERDSRRVRAVRHLAPPGPGRRMIRGGSVSCPDPRAVP
ncbi:ATP-binding protein [Streptomyces phaeofaciens]|uniref:ATP-binding protein n=1 Tax=Streptomyces phaeofaciens TaxID=68254 RepID=UPI00367BD94B